MRRLLLVPIVVAPVAVAGVLAWFSGMAWPIATTAAAVVIRRRPGPDYEADLIA